MMAHAQAHRFTPRKRPSSPYPAVAAAAEHISLAHRWEWGVEQAHLALDDAEEAREIDELGEAIHECCADGEVTPHEYRRMVREWQDVREYDEQHENPLHDQIADHNARAMAHSGRASMALDRAVTAANCHQEGRHHSADVLELVECEAAGQLVLLEGE